MNWQWLFQCNPVGPPVLRAKIERSIDRSTSRFHTSASTAATTCVYCDSGIAFRCYAVTFVGKFLSERQI